MSNSSKTLRQYFIRLGFSITRDEISESFGNFIIEGCTNTFCIRGLRDRSDVYIEVRAQCDPNEWFILNIVMSLVLRERKLVDEISLEEQMEFVESNFDRLETLFSVDLYPAVKSQLMELVQLRGKLLFPEWYE